MKILSLRENSPKGEETAQKFLMSENVKKGEGVKKVHNLAPPRCVNFAIQGEDETLREKGEDPLYRVLAPIAPGCYGPLQNKMSQTGCYGRECVMARSVRK